MSCGGGCCAARNPYFIQTEMHSFFTDMEIKIPDEDRPEQTPAASPQLEDARKDAKDLLTEITQNSYNISEIKLFLKKYAAIFKSLEEWKQYKKLTLQRETTYESIEYLKDDLSEKLQALVDQYKDPVIYDTARAYNKIYRKLDQELDEVKELTTVILMKIDEAIQKLEEKAFRDGPVIKAQREKADRFLQTLEKYYEKLDTFKQKLDNSITKQEMDDLRTEMISEKDDARDMCNVLQKLTTEYNDVDLNNYSKKIKTLHDKYDKDFKIIVKKWKAVYEKFDGEKHKFKDDSSGQAAASIATNKELTPYYWMCNDFADWCKKEVYVTLETKLRTKQLKSSLQKLSFCAAVLTENQGKPYSLAQVSHQLLRSFLHLHDQNMQSIISTYLKCFYQVVTEDEAFFVLKKAIENEVENFAEVSEYYDISLLKEILHDDPKSILTTASPLLYGIHEGLVELENKVVLLEWTADWKNNLKMFKYNKGPFNIIFDLNNSRPSEEIRVPTVILPRYSKDAFKVPCASQNPSEPETLEELRYHFLSRTLRTLEIKFSLLDNRLYDETPLDLGMIEDTRDENYEPPKNKQSASSKKKQMDRRLQVFATSFPELEEIKHYEFAPFILQNELQWLIKQNRKAYEKALSKVFDPPGKPKNRKEFDSEWIAKLVYIHCDLRTCIAIISDFFENTFNPKIDNKNTQKLMVTSITDKQSIAAIDHQKYTYQMFFNLIFGKWTENWLTCDEYDLSRVLDYDNSTSVKRQVLDKEMNSVQVHWNEQQTFWGVHTSATYTWICEPVDYAAVCAKWLNPYKVEKLKELKEPYSEVYGNNPEPLESKELKMVLTEDQLQGNKNYDRLMTVISGVRNYIRDSRKLIRTIHKERAEEIIRTKALDNAEKYLERKGQFDFFRNTNKAKKDGYNSLDGISLGLAALAAKLEAKKKGRRAKRKQNTDNGANDGDNDDDDDDQNGNKFHALEERGRGSERGSGGDAGGSLTPCRRCKKYECDCPEGKLRGRGRGRGGKKNNNPQHYMNAGAAGSGRARGAATYNNAKREKAERRLERMRNGQGDYDSDDPGDEDETVDSEFAAAPLAVNFARFFSGGECVYLTTEHSRFRRPVALNAILQIDMT